MLIHSLKFDIHSNSVNFGEELDVLYRPNDLLSTFPSHARSLWIQIELAGSRHSLPLEPITGDNGTFAEVNLMGGMCWFAGGCFYSTCDGEFSSETEFDPLARRIRSNLGGRYASVSPDALLALVLKQIMQSFVLPFFRLKFLHGAVVTKDGATIMLTGPGGAGKSTTSLRLVEAGYTLLSDDGPLFTHHDGETLALSSLDFCQVTEKTLELLPFLRPAVVGEVDHRGKHRVGLCSLQPSESWRVPHRVTHVVRLERRKCTHPRLVLSDRRDFLARTLGEAMTVFRSPTFTENEMFRSHSQFTFDVITSLARGARTYCLEFDDSHLDLIPDLIGELNH